ncbi:MAG TPA: acetylglutamate kinase [Gemmatimonadaceae bacterium]|nr:acetylglutamate kinase [Gemmatimonadaceae bacterium]
MRVVKLGGRAQEDVRLPSVVRAAWAAAPGALCVIHGGGDQVSRLQRTLGAPAEFVRGRRVTREADIQTIRMALSGGVNKELAARLTAAGVPALGLSGEDAGLLGARRIADEALGLVGEPAWVDVALLRHVLAGSYLPVVSPLARDLDAALGEASALNLNGDDAAAAIAVALEADELLFVSDVPGVKANGMVLPLLDMDEAVAAISDGIATGGMVAKLSAAMAAMERGVARVRIGDLDALLDPARGTVLAPSRSLV